MAEAISQFFSNRLGAALSNDRWSWGAYDATNNRLFLRVWEHGLSPDRSMVEVMWHDDPRTDNGMNERRKHVELMAMGAETFGVLCLKDDRSEQTRIKSFETDVLLKLGAPVRDGDRAMAPILQRVDVNLLNEILDREDAEEAAIWIDGSLTETEKKNLVNARRGQGLYRRRLLERWDYRCAATGCNLLDAIRASHAKPWRQSSNMERLDPDNGLPLVATLDALFDRGLIAFSRTGLMLVSDRIDKGQRVILGVPTSLRRRPGKRCGDYLQWHLDQKFFR